MLLPLLSSGDHNVRVRGEWEMNRAARMLQGGKGYHVCVCGGGGGGVRGKICVRPLMGVICVAMCNFRNQGHYSVL